MLAPAAGWLFGAGKEAKRVTESEAASAAAQKARPLAKRKIDGWALLLWSGSGASLGGVRALELGRIPLHDWLALNRSVMAAMLEALVIGVLANQASARRFFRWCLALPLTALLLGR